MTNMTTREPEPLSRQLWHRRRLIAVVTGLCLLAAVLAGLLRPAVHTAEAKLRVGSGQMTALNIPGYPSAAQDMASDFARYVDMDGVFSEQLPEGAMVKASPIVESNVIQIEATAPDAKTAVLAAQQTADGLMGMVNQVRTENDPAELMAEIQTNVGPLLEARRAAQEAAGTYESASDEDQPAIEVERRFDAYIEATKTLNALELEQNARQDRYRSLVASQSTEADLHMIHGGTSTGSDRMAVLQRNAFLGLLGGLVLSCGLAVLLEARGRRSSHRETEQPVAASEVQGEEPDRELEHDLFEGSDEAYDRSRMEEAEAVAGERHATSGTGATRA